jgi:hypothetical protein
VHRQACHPPLGLDRHPIAALNPFQRTANRERLAGGRLKRRAGREIGLGFIGPAEAGIAQAAEIIGPRIAAAGVDRRRQLFVGFPVIAGEIGMDAASIHFVKQRVLPPARRTGKRQRQ